MAQVPIAMCITGNNINNAMVWVIMCLAPRDYVPTDDM
jgi:hypothetical protein